MPSLVIINSFLVLLRVVLGESAQGHVLNADQKMNLLKPVIREEIKKTLFSIPEDKSPWPDGFVTSFYKEAQAIVGSDVIKAIQDFFTHGKILKETNFTLPTLIPKVKCPSNVSEFRPIASCNVVYKCITKILCD